MLHNWYTKVVVCTVYCRMIHKIIVKNRPRSFLSRYLSSLLPYVRRYININKTFTGCVCVCVCLCGGGGGLTIYVPILTKVQARPPRDQRLATQPRVSERETFTSLLPSFIFFCQINLSYPIFSLSSRLPHVRRHEMS